MRRREVWGLMAAILDRTSYVNEAKTGCILLLSKCVNFTFGKRDVMCGSRWGGIGGLDPRPWKFTSYMYFYTI